MTIKPEQTPDGIKLRNTKTGNLAGSIGKGKKSPAAAQVSGQNKPVIKEEEESAIERARAQYEAQKSKPIFTSFMDCWDMEDLVALVVDDTQWIPASRKGTHSSYPWNSAGINAQLEKWSDWYTWHKTKGDDDPEYEEVSSPDPAFRYEDNENILAHTHLDPRAIARLGYEHYLAQPYPCFVYGTLRPGEYNFESMFNKGGVEGIAEGIMNGVSLYVRPEAPFPSSAEDGEDAFMVGDIVWLQKNRLGYRVRQEMDILESFDKDYPEQSNYKRVTKKVKFIKDGIECETTAWVYVSSGYIGSILKKENIVADGNWLNIASRAKQDPTRRKRDLSPSNWGNPE